MRMNSVIFFISISSYQNELGDTIETPINRKTFAEKTSVRQSEFYQAAVTGLKPELTFVVWLNEYKGEKKIKFAGKEYNIIRTFEKNDKELELVCAGMAGDV